MANELGLRGSTALIQVITQWAQQASEDFEDTRQQLRAANADRDALRTNIANAQTELATLRERLAGHRDAVGMRVLAISIGTLIVGFGPYTGSLMSAVIMTVLGITLVVSGCVLMYRGPK